MRRRTLKLTTLLAKFEEATREHEMRGMIVGDYGDDEANERAATEVERIERRHAALRRLLRRTLAGRSVTVELPDDWEGPL